MVIRMFFYLPHPLIVIMRAAVKIVVIVIFLQIVYRTANLNPRPADTVSAAAYGSAERSVSPLISCRVVISQYDVPQFLVFVRHKKPYESCAVIRKIRLDPVFVFQQIQMCLCSVLCSAESCHFLFFHVHCLLVYIFYTFICLFYGISFSPSQISVFFQVYLPLLSVFSHSGPPS